MTDRERTPPSTSDEPQIDPRAVVGARVRARCWCCGREVVTRVVAVDVWPETLERPAAPAPIIEWPDGRRRWMRVEGLELVDEAGEGLA